MREGENVALVALCDAFGPKYPRLRWNAQLRFRLFRLFGTRLPKAPDFGWKSIFREIATLWAMRLQILSGRLTARPVPQRTRYLHWLDLAAVARRRYQVRAYPGPVALFRLKSQPSEVLYHPEPLRGWDSQIVERLEVIDLNLAPPFPGAHTTMMAEPHVSGVADKLCERLRTAQATCLSNAWPTAPGRS